MTSRPFRSSISTALGAAVLLLAGCGGSDDIAAVTPSTATTQPGSVPASAGASTAAFVAYLQSLATSDTTEPLDVSAFSASATLTDTDEPIAIGT